MQHTDSEFLVQLEDELQAALLKSIPAEKRLQGLSPEDRVQGLSPEDRLRGLSPGEVLQGFTPEGFAAGLTEEQAARLRRVLEAKQRDQG